MVLPGCALPEDKLPQCWSDDVRMNALFAPFRIKSANPESWDMKMKFWSDLLRQWCKYKKDPIFCSADAKLAFQWKKRTCACLDIVVEEMYSNGELSPVSKYQQILRTGPEGWARWGARLAFKPVALAFTTVTSIMPGGKLTEDDGSPKASIDPSQKFVLESVVKDLATELLYNYPPGVERVGTIDELMKASGCQQGRETFEVLLGYLLSQGSAVKDEDIVKLGEPDKKSTPITETDKALVKLVAAEAKLACEATRLTRDVDAATADARVSLQFGNRPDAKNHLKRKHKAQQRLIRCEAALDNVKHLLHQMREVDVNAAIVDTYKTSSEAMKRGMKESGLSEDAVHDTMDDLKDVLESYGEVEKALGTTVEDFDAAELENELMELLERPPAPSGGTPAKAEPAPRREPRKQSERDYVLEERILQDLESLDIEETSPAPQTSRQRAERVAVAAWGPADKQKQSPGRATKNWYLPVQNDTWSTELRQDERLHPGQQPEVDYTSPSGLYSNDFQVQDHKMENGVWYYNGKDDGFEAGTEYFSPESPGRTGGTFQMAPGGERRKQQQQQQPEEEAVDELERRLKNLRGYL